jgi:hypothetical protein
MTSCQSCTLWTTGLLGILLVLTGCTSTYDTAVRQLSPAEQAEFALYQQVMTAAQARTYLAKASAAERTAYLSEIGVAQRLQRLDPLDREAVQSGAPRVGMSAEALLFVWGDPADTAGDARYYARWHYFGSSLGRSTHYHPWETSTRVEVYLAKGKVLGWVDFINEDAGGESERRSR